MILLSSVSNPVLLKAYGLPEILIEMQILNPRLLNQNLKGRAHKSSFSKRLGYSLPRYTGMSEAMYVEESECMNGLNQERKKSSLTICYFFSPKTGASAILQHWSILGSLGGTRKKMQIS